MNQCCFLLLLLCIGESFCGVPQRDHESGDDDQSENSSTATAHGSSGGGVISGHKRRGHHPSWMNGVGVADNGEGIRTILETKWVPAALKYFEFSRCTATNIGSDDECYKLGTIKREQVAVYLGISSSNRFDGSTKFSSSGEKVFAILPDSNSAKSGGAHDGVLVLDPYPDSPFGHLVAMFYLDWVGLGVEGQAQCKDPFQTLTSDGTCITVGRKHRCPNLLERYTSSGLHSLSRKQCHVDFLPTVYSEERVALSPVTLLQGKVDPSRYPDLLTCIPLPGFSPCPKLRTLEDTSKILCDSALANSKRCDTTHATVGSSCKLFQTCDRAVLIGGGWNRAHSPSQTLDNIRLISTSLQDSGFAPDNINTFYANGKSLDRGQIPTPSRSSASASARSGAEYFSSAMKTALRGHIRTTCDNPHCADTLFIYLNNPATTEGDFLLWDMDGNGMADEGEVYTVKEFLSDLAGCEAKRVVVLVEQSNSELLMASLKNSGGDHGNVILLSAGLPNQVIQGGEFTRSWVNRVNTSPTACLRHVYQMTASYMTGSNPVFFEMSRGLSSKLNLVGAPCDLSPPVSSRELKTMYQGCQNVPTSIWFSFDFEELGGEIGVEMESGRSPSKEETLEDEDGTFSIDGGEGLTLTPRKDKHHRRHSSTRWRRRQTRSKLSASVTVDS